MRALLLAETHMVSGADGSASSNAGNGGPSSGVQNCPTGTMPISVTIGGDINVPGVGSGGVGLSVSTCLPAPKPPKKTDDDNTSTKKN